MKFSCQFRALLPLPRASQRARFWRATCALSLVYALIGCKADVSVNDEPADPVTQEFPLLYIERPLVLADEQPLPFDLFDPSAFNPGARLIFKKNAFAQSAESDVLDAVFGAGALYDVKDLAVAPDGRSAIFAAHPPRKANTPERLQPTWALYRFDLASMQVTPIHSSEAVRQQGHDIAPEFLTDGRIVFSSTRGVAAKQILLDEFRPQYTALDEDNEAPVFSLHRMTADGSGIEQISFNMSHDLSPMLLADGRLGYVRWDNQQSRSMLNLYRMTPDGSKTELLYGWHSHSTGVANSRVEFVKPQRLASNELAVLVTSNNAPYYNSWPMRIDIDNASDHNQALANKTLVGSAQTPLFPWAFSNSATIDRAGAVHSLFALHDGTERYLVSWSPCRAVVNTVTVACSQVPAGEPLVYAAPLYGLWLFDNQAKTQVPVKPGSEGRLISEAVVLQARKAVPYVADQQGRNAELAAENAALLDIRSVYDIAGVETSAISRLRDPQQTRSNDRPARYLRIDRQVPRPPRDVQPVPNFAFGVTAVRGMREIVGFVPIEPDGSVKVKIPANVPIAINVLNSKGRSVSAAHQQWITARPGETIQCNGCHQANSTAPHGRYNGEGEAASANPGAPVSNQPFPNADPALPAQLGETMAQTLNRLTGLKTLKTALEYQDHWTDPARRSKEPDQKQSYQDLTTALPIGMACFDKWQAHCRLRIDYPSHIAPLWSMQRVTRDSNGEVLTDHTCINCHSRTAADGSLQVPAGQLELTAEPSDQVAEQMTSYRELLAGDFEQAIVGGVLVDRQVQQVDANGNLVWVRDAQGNLVLDANGNPIPVLVRVPISSPAVAGRALSSRVFTVLEGQGSHAGYLSAAELKLLGDWLDIGAQYYNSPFAVPQ